MIAGILSKRGVYGIIIFILSWSLNSCHSGGSTGGTTSRTGQVAPAVGQNKKPENEEEIEPTDTLRYIYDQYLLKSELAFADSLQMEDSTYFQLDFPRFEDTQVQDFIQLVQLGTDTTNIYAAAKQFIAEYEDYQLSVPYPRVWSYETSTQVDHISPVYLGLKSEHYSYTGGAHGLYAFWFSHFWIPTGEVLHFDDLIDTSRMDELLPLAEKYFWAQEQKNHSDMEPELYFFNEQKFHLPDNIHFERDSVLFLYNIYEIKPYVYGHTEFRVPLSEIESFMSEKAKRIVREINK